MYATQWKDASRRKVMSDVADLVRDAEDYLAASAGQTGEALAAARERMRASLASAKQAVRAADEATRATARTADAFVHRNTWRMLAAAACLGVLAGWLTGRR